MRLLAALVLCLLSASAAAQPASMTYPQWIERARAADAPALGALARGNPAFARAWFYGNLFDLAVEQIPQAQRDALKPKLAAVGEATGDALAWPVDGDDIGRKFGAVQGMRDAWVANARAGDPTAPMLASIQRPEIATPIFYRLLYRAATVGPTTPEGILNATTARHMAAGRLVVTGATDWWQDLAAWHGGEVPARGPQDADDALTRTLNAFAIRGEPKAMLRQGEIALDSARRRRPDSLYTALVLNLSALAAGWVGRAQAALTLHVQVQQMVRPLKIPRLDAALLGRLLMTALKGERVADAQTYLDQLQALDEAGRVTRATAELLRDAAEVVQDRLRAARDAGDLETREHALTLFCQIAEMIRAPAVDRMFLRRPGPVLERAVAQARQSQGELALLSGRFDDAAQAFDRAATVWRSVQAPRGVATADALRAEALWRAGEEGEARAILTRLVTQSVGIDRAMARMNLAALRLAGGDPAPAFAHANEALRTLAGAEPALRSALHSVAAQALHMTGETRQAAERFEQGMRLNPEDPWLPRFAAITRLALGDEAGALTAASALATPDLAAVLRGCVLTRSGKHADALAALAAVGKLGQPHQAWHRLEGLLCQVHAQMSTGDWAAARDGLKVARSTALAVPDPVLDWRLRVLEGREYAHRERWLQAAGVWRQALITLSTLGAEVPARGAFASVVSVAPGDPMAVADALVDALVAASAADPSRADVHLRAAMGVALWARQLAAAPRASALPAAAWRPAEDRARHRLLARLARTRGALALAMVQGAGRARLSQQMRTLDSALTTAAAQLHTAAPAWASYLTPRIAPPADLPGAALAVYHFGEGGHVFLSVDGLPVRHFALARADVIRAALAPALAVILDAEMKPDWATLQAPVDAVLPFLSDAKAAKALQGKPLWFVPDGPLVAFPIEALVTDAAGPTFASDAGMIRRAVVGQAAAAVTPAPGLGAIGADDKETRGVLGGQAPTPANPASFQADFAARGTQWITVSADLKAGVLSLTGDEAGRLGEADLAFGPGGAVAVVLARAQAPLDSGAGARRMAAALHHRGVKDVVWVTGRVDGDVAFGQQIAAAIRGGQGLAAALGATKTAARAKTPHPHAWARWMHTATLPAR